MKVKLKQQEARIQLLMHDKKEFKRKLNKSQRDEAFQEARDKKLRAELARGTLSWMQIMEVTEKEEKKANKVQATGAGAEKTAGRGQHEGDDGEGQPEGQPHPGPHERQ